MRAAVFAGIGTVDIVDRPEPEPVRPDDVVIEIAANGICGSDLRGLADPPEMTYIEDVVIGHEFTGRVTGVGNEVTTVREGSPVVIAPSINCQRCWFCRAGHLNLCDDFTHIGVMRDGGAAGASVVPERMVFELPEHLDLELATLTEPLACVLNGTQQAAVKPGDSALVLGGGPVGALYAMLFKAAGANPVIVSEPSAHRRELALTLGADLVIDPTSADLDGLVAESTEDRGAEVAVDAVGHLLADAVRLTRKGGKVLVFGLNDRMRADLSISDIVSREVQIRGVYIANGTFPRAIRLLQQNTLGFEHLLTHRMDLEQFMDAIAVSRSGEAMKALVIPER
jgi:2-desacetyl-2-hydroxyethyl bacteriochlorophyllide A dehydrogenase